MQVDTLDDPRPSLAYRRPFADVWLRPWFDSLSLHFLRRTFLPLSSGWAAAEAAEGDRDAFRAALGLQIPNSAKLETALAATASHAAAWRQAERSWSDSVFAETPPGDAALLAAERARGRAAQEFMASRRFFGPWRGRLPAARWDIATPDQVERRHGARLADMATAYPAPPDVAVTRSAALPAPRGSLSWLRFTSPVLGDSVTVRVQEPPNAGPDTPTIVLLHGIAMEDEMWRDKTDSLAPLLAAGWRILRPEGPWHGRRRPRGSYGGERVLAPGIDGFLTLFQAWLAEIAVLLDWARRQGGPVTLSGISLGALTAQLYASAVRRWQSGPAPDALLLIATCGSIRGAAYDGALAQGLGMPGRLAEAGWSDATLDSWLPLLEPAECSVPPERALLLLGRSDRVTPFAGGRQLAERWHLPPENVFLRRQGHFSVSLGLVSDPAPLMRLIAMMRQ